MAGTGTVPKISIPFPSVIIINRAFSFLGYFLPVCGILLILGVA